MELLAPAGNAEKLRFVLRYGADAAYMGFGDFSLRSQAGGMEDLNPQELRTILGSKKLYAALNSYYLPGDLDRLDQELPRLKDYPISALIISDLGALPLVQKHFPDREVHLSTQANCLNHHAAALYKKMGFSRVILGREVPLDQIKRIKDEVPDVELEVFVHGAMCWAYSGRCYLSRGLSGSGRSGNTGDCAHSCRWDYKLYLEEAKRPGEFLEVDEEEGYTALLSSRDLNMIGHLQELKEAGVDSIKIEGRLKSLYYGALATRAYRAALNKLEGKTFPWTDDHMTGLEEIPHRDYSTGFYFGHEPMNLPLTNPGNKIRNFMGYVGPYAGEGEYQVEIKGPFRAGEPVEFVSPDGPTRVDTTWVLRERDQGPLEKADPGSKGKLYFIKSAVPLAEGMIIRSV